MPVLNKTGRHLLTTLPSFSEHFNLHSGKAGAGFTGNLMHGPVRLWTWAE